MSPATTIAFPRAARVGIAGANVSPTYQGARSMAHATVYEDGEFELLARFEMSDGSQVIQADISDVTISLFDSADGSTDWVDQRTYAVADVLSDTLTVDGRWTEDADGFNFAWVYDQNMRRLEGGRTYLIEVVMNRADAAPISERYTVEVTALLSRRT